MPQRTKKEIFPSDIEALALQLKESLERTKDPIPAGDFHFAAMEMKREQAKDQKRKWRARGLWIYKMLSGYGERPVRAFIWFLCTIAIATLLFTLFGDKCFWQALFSSFQHSLPFKVASTVSGALDGSEPSHWIGLGETFVGSFIFTLFGLALRRRFKR